MGTYTLKVPAEHVEAFRTIVYSSLAGEGETLQKRGMTLAYPDGHEWREEIGDDSDKVEQYAVEILTATRNIAALVAVMDQLGWTDPIEGEVELTGDPELLALLLEGCLVDAGSNVSYVTDTSPFDRAAFDAATARGGWLADRHAEVAA